MTAAELIRELNQGNEELRREFYKRYHKAAYHTAYRLVNDAAAAEDLCHDTILHALKHLHQLRNTDAPDGWIKTIARNFALAHLKSRSRFELTDSLIEDDWTDDNPTDADHLQFSTDDILRELNQLPEGYRIIITLHLLEDLTHEEIATELGISPATSRSQYLRGRQKLRKRLIEHHEQRI